MADEQLSGTERAIFGDRPVAAVRDVLDAYARRRLGSGIAAVRFRAGQIDAVWAVRLHDGQDRVIKAPASRSTSPRRPP